MGLMCFLINYIRVNKQGIMDMQSYEITSIPSCPDKIFKFNHLTLNVVPCSYLAINIC